MKRVVLAIVLLLVSCAHFAGIDWQDELKNTHWTGYKNGQFNPAVSQLKMQGQGYYLYNGKLVTFTRLNEEGIKIMNTMGCGGCHQEGGALPSNKSVIMYQERSAGQQPQETK